MDENLGGWITWGEARARLDEAASRAAARLVVEVGGACPLRFADVGVSRTGGLDHLDLVFAATCPEAAAPLRVGTTLFAEIDPSHRLLLTSTEGGRSSSAVLASGEAPAELAPEAGPLAALAECFAAGVEHLLAGADHLVFLLVLILPAAVALSILLTAIGRVWPFLPGPARCSRPSSGRSTASAWPVPRRG